MKGMRNEHVPPHVDETTNTFYHKHLDTHKSSDLSRNRRTFSTPKDHPLALPRIIAHRGVTDHLAENSLAAFREAVRLGLDGVELDVHAGPSGHLFVQHDDLPAGDSVAEEGLLQLTEALDVIGTGALEAWIEIKCLPETADERLLATIDAAPRPDLCRVHSFDHRIIARLGRKRQGVPLGILSSSYPVDPVAELRNAGANTLWQHWRLIDEDLVRQVGKIGGQVIAWTVNEPQVASRLASWGVWGLCSDEAVRIGAGEFGARGK